MNESKNPLLEPVVVAVLLEKVPKWMWATCRLVCKTWHYELFPRWRKQMTVLIGGMGKNYLTDHDVNKLFMEILPWMETYEDNDIRQLEQFPFRSIKTIAGQVSVGWTYKEILVQNSFWSLCGPCLHHLHFHGVLFKDLEMFKNIIYRLTPNLKELEFSGCHVPETKEVEKNDPKDVIHYRPGEVQVQPNLKILKISLQAFRKSRCFGGRFPLNFLSLLSVFPHIEEVTLCEFGKLYSPDDFMNYFLNVISTIRGANQNPVLNIKMLDIRHLNLDLNPNMVTDLCALSLPLEKLHIQIDSMRNTLQQLFLAYSALKKLSLCIFHNEPLTQTFHYEVLPPKLTELELNGVVFEDWTFLGFVPNLIKLKLHNQNYGPIRLPKIFPDNKIPLLELLTTFSYQCGVGVRDVLPIESVRILAKIMPNVTKLTLSVTCAGFRTVCDVWPKLTCWKISYALVKEFTFIANVKKLTGLTCLHVHVADENDGEIMKGFGNDSIREGFLLMPKLQRLCITFRHGITEELLKDLYDKVKDTKGVFVVRHSDLSKKDPLVYVARNTQEKSTRMDLGRCHIC